MRAVFIGVGLVCSALAFAAAESTVVPYPAGYRKWVHVKSTVIGPTHARFESNGGMHFTFMPTRKRSRVTAAVSSLTARF